jgi:hypothetical protein
MVVPCGEGRDMNDWQATRPSGTAQGSGSGTWIRADSASERAWDALRTIRRGLGGWHLAGPRSLAARIGGYSYPQCSQGRHFAASHQLRAGNVSVRVVLTQSHQDLAILEHLEIFCGSWAPLSAQTKTGSGAASAQDARSRP